MDKIDLNVCASDLTHKWQHAIRGGLATVAIWQSPHGPLDSGLLRACFRISFVKQKKNCMFPVVHLKTALRDTFF